MINPGSTTDDELDDPYIREVPIEEFTDDVEKASEEQEFEGEE